MDKAVYALPEDLVSHNHFKVAVSDGLINIRAYEKSEFNTLDNKELKFVKANDIIPTDVTNTLTLNGKFIATEFKQVNKDGALSRVVDESATVFSGKAFGGEEIEAGAFNASEKSF